MEPRTVAPLDAARQRQVRRATATCLRRAGEICRCDFPPVPVSFDLRGRAAGMYRVRQGGRSIRYNPYIFAKFFEDNLRVTVAHEVAHYVTDLLYGLHRIRPHGAEWRAIMHSLGVEARASASYDLSGVPVRRERIYAYSCGCARHHLSSRRHHKVRRGEARYRCRGCGLPLVFSGEAQ